LVWPRSRGDRKCDSVIVETETGETFGAAKLVVTAGPWAPELLANIDVKLSVLRKHLYWFPTTDPQYHEGRGCPTYLYELPHGVFYGFPQIDASGVKAAEHSGGKGRQRSS
jgi:glycine/D-amino acid oxidase-like deaminating enzyme